MVTPVTPVETSGLVGIFVKEPRGAQTKRDLRTRRRIGEESRQWEWNIQWDR